jgi:20S proteasome subunit alpha 5
MEAIKVRPYLLFRGFAHDFAAHNLRSPSSSQLGSTTVGIATPHGCVLAVEKRIQSSLLESSSVEKIMEIDSHIGCAMSGLTADARTMVEHARMTGQMHAFTYDEPIKVESVTQAVCDLALRFGESVEDEEAMMVGLAMRQSSIARRIPVLTSLRFISHARSV